MMSGVIISNYAGGGVSVSMGTNFGMQITNYTTHAGFNISTNGHITAVDEFGATFKFHTNGVLSVVQPGGVSFVLSNGVITDMSGGALFGWMVLTNPLYPGQLSDSQQRQHGHQR